MPFAGTQANPSANMRSRKSSRDASVPSDRSKNTPPKKLRKNRSMVPREIPAAPRRSSAERPLAGPGPSDGPRSAARAKGIIRSASAGGTAPRSTPATAASGSRSGCAMVAALRPFQTTAPDMNALRSSARRSTNRGASGYADRNTWNPRSTMYAPPGPWTTSLATRPPTRSVASSTSTLAPRSASVRAADSPAMPAPTTMMCLLLLDMVVGGSYSERGP